jgi:hypothetical protein
MDLLRDLGDRPDQAQVLTHLAESLLSAGSQRAAADAWREALVILEELEHPDAGPVRARLAQLSW